MLRNYAQEKALETDLFRQEYQMDSIQVVSNKNQASEQSTKQKHDAEKEAILEDFMEARFRHQEAREQLRHLLNTFVRPHAP